MKYIVTLKVNLKIGSGQILSQGHEFCGPAEDFPPSIQDLIKNPNPRVADVVELPLEEVLEADGEKTTEMADLPETTGGSEIPSETETSKKDDVAGEGEGVQVPAETPEGGEADAEVPTEVEPVVEVEVVTGDGSGESLPDAEETPGVAKEDTVVEKPAKKPATLKRGNKK